jgi:sec-independent protein translocase protein TatA
LGQPRAERHARLDSPRTGNSVHRKRKIAFGIEEKTLKMNLGPTELIIIFVIGLLIFGVGRVGKIGGELGSAIREFRNALKPEGEKKEDSN